LTVENKAVIKKIIYPLIIPASIDDEINSRTKKMDSGNIFGT